MLGRVLFFVLFLGVFCVFAQQPGTTPNEKKTDELLFHLGEAESFQIAGDLASAAAENRIVVGIALQRMGNALMEEGKYDEAAALFKKSLAYSDSAPNRTLLALAYLRQDLADQALSEAKAAVAIDADHIGARYILGNIFYAKEDYPAALPHLAFVFEKAPDFEIARALGLTYLNLRKIDEARAHFEKMQGRAGGKNADLNVLFAKFYERTNYPADAERELKRAIENDPAKPKTNFYLGYLLLQNGGSERLGEAGAAFEKELKITPNDFYSLFFSGVVASSVNDHEKAVGFLKRAVEINPNSGEAFLFLGQSQIELEDVVSAEQNLRRAVELEKNGGKNTQARRTHFMLGRLLLKTGRKDEGKAELEIAGKLQQQSLDSSRDEIERILGQVAEKNESQAVENVKSSSPVVKIEPERAEQLKKLREFLFDVAAQAYSNIGVIEIRFNRYDSAIENFSEAFKLKPDYPNLARNLGIVSFRAGQYEKAIIPLESHLKQNPDDELVRKMLGSSYYFSKNYPRASEVLSSLEKSLSTDPELAYFYGISLVQQKKNDRAETVFQSLAAASKLNPESLFYAAQGFMILGDFARAASEFNEVLALAPQTAKANYFIGQSMIRLNRLADAESAFTKELAITPGDAVSKYHLALTLIERKIETDRAIANLKEAIELRPDYADAFYQLGKIYLEKGDLKSAVSALESAVSADSDKDYIHYQLSIAYRKSSRKDDADRELKIYQQLKNSQRSTEGPMPMGGNEIVSPE